MSLRSNAARAACLSVLVLVCRCASKNDEVTPTGTADGGGDAARADDDAATADSAVDVQTTDAAVDVETTDAAASDGGGDAALDVAIVDSALPDAFFGGDGGVTNVTQLELAIFEGTELSALDTSSTAIASHTVTQLSAAAPTSDYPSYTHYADGVGWRLVDPSKSVDASKVIATDVFVACALDGVASPAPCTPSEIRAKSPDFALHPFKVIVRNTAGATRTWSFVVTDVPANHTAQTATATVASSTVTVPTATTQVLTSAGSGVSNVVVNADALLYLESSIDGFASLSMAAGAGLFANTAIFGGGPSVVTMRSTSRMYVFGALQDIDFRVEPGAVVLFDSAFNGQTIGAHP